MLLVGEDRGPVMAPHDSATLQYLQNVLTQANMVGTGYGGASFTGL